MIIYRKRDKNKKMKFYTKQDKEDYKNWHKNRYQKDFELAEKIKSQDENWAIIIGYYAMHNITKLFLAEKNVFLTGGDHIHEQCIQELEKVSVKEEKYLKDKLLMLKKAKEVFDNLILNPKDWPGILRLAKTERSGANYYTNRELSEAEEFLSKIAKPYLKTFEELIKND